MLLKLITRLYLLKLQDINPEQQWTNFAHNPNLEQYIKTLR